MKKLPSIALCLPDISGKTEAPARLSVKPLAIALCGAATVPLSKEQIFHKSANSAAVRLANAFLLAAAMMASSAYALESLEDTDMGGITGEGIAFLPENAYFAFRGAGVNEAAAAVLSDRSKDTGYIHLLPVGPLSDQSLNNATYGTTTGKADVYLYGLAISRGDGDSNSRLNATSPTIRGWGSATNPWLLKVQTESSVQDFSTTDSAGKSVPYLALEAPLYNTFTFSGSNVTGGGPATSGLGNSVDAYNLKLAYWADIFNRKWDALEGASNQFDVGGSGRQNRLRMQAVWDGLSINGTNMRMFQTLGGATNTGGMSTSYNNTFGMAQLIRMNSGDTRNLKATISDNTVANTGVVTAWNNVHGGWSSTLNPAQTGGDCGNGGATNTGYSNTGSAGCQYMVQNRSRTDSKTRTMSWAMPGTSGVLRISTQETTGSAVDLTTPATNGTSAPSFAANEGLYMYAPNINLPLGSLAQPLTAGLASDGRNLVLEVARIPNKASAYNAIYTDYTNNADVIAKNCNVYRCGTALTGALAGYQASSATHGSISIGTTNYDATTNLLTAYSGAEAFGISFGALSTNTIVATESVTTKEVQYKQRQFLSQTWQSAEWCASFFIGCLNYDQGTGTLTQWQYYNGTAYATGATAVTLPGSATCSGNCNVSSGAVTYDGTTYTACPLKANCTRYGTNSNRAWTYSSSLGTWLTTSNAAVNGFIGAANGTTGAPNLSTAANLAATPTYTNPMPLNNLGSAVIDGLLIQHMKFTTTGL